eukprot:6907677-Ditylum_brightwellii.AAC.1
MEWHCFSPEELREIFNLSLGPKFKSLHNSIEFLPLGWDTKYMEALTTQACEYLATIISNKGRNKLQHNIIKQEAPKGKDEDSSSKRSPPPPVPGGSNVS